MRVTLIIHSLYSGGAERVMSILTNYWAAKGWDITLLTFCSPTDSPFYDLDRAITYCPLNINQDSSGLLSALTHNWHRLRVLRSAIVHSRPDVVISFMTTTNILVLLATRGLKIPILVSERNDLEAYHPGGYWELLRRWTYQFADRIIVQTAKAAAYFPPSMQSQVTLIPNPVLRPLRSQVSEVTLPKHSIVAVGRLEPQKGFDLLLRAFAALKNDFPAWKLTILGEGTLRPALLALCEELGIRDRVDLPGRAKDIYGFLKAADLFVMPSRFEGFPNALCEAMACGLPVISTDCPGCCDIIRDGLDGLLVPRENVAELTGAMKLLLSDEAKRQALSARAPEVVERFSLEKIMDMWEAAASQVSDSELQSFTQPNAMKKVAFMIRDLNYGGAQRQLITLAKELDKKRFDITVLCFYSNGKLETDLSEHGIPVICLEKRDRWDVVRFLWQLFRQLKRIRPDVLHGYLSESNLLTLGFKLMSPSTRIVWGIRDSNISLDSYDWLDRLIFELECWLSRFVDLVIVNSHAGRSYHVAHGFLDAKMRVIPNGIDTARFKPDRTKGAEVRSGWGVDPNTRLIGLVGRFDPMKDHPTFLKAAALLCQERSDVRFVCVGSGSQRYQQDLQTLATELGICDRIIWAGGRSDMPAVYNALDIACSSSAYGEGFANVVGEAMACEVPCVVTDVGDSAWIVGNTGIVVPPRDPTALKQGITQLIEAIETKQYSPHQARKRILTQFSVTKLSSETQSALL